MIVAKIQQKLFGIIIELYQVKSNEDLVMIDFIDPMLKINEDFSFEHKNNKNGNINEIANLTCSKIDIEEKDGVYFISLIENFKIEEKASEIIVGTLKVDKIIKEDDKILN